MTRLTQVSWLTHSEREALAKHHVLTLEQLAVFETTDSTANEPSVFRLREKAKRARQSLGHADPLAQLGQAAGVRPGTPVRYAGGITHG